MCSGQILAACTRDPHVQAQFASLMSEWVKPGKVLPCRVRLEFSEGAHRRSDYGSDVWFDAKYALVLMLEGPEHGMVMAHVGFDLRNTTDGLRCLEIKQLQGRRVRSRWVSDSIAAFLEASYDALRWERFLVHAVLALARSTKSLDVVSIQRAEDNYYYTLDLHPDFTAREHQNRLYCRYDVTARRSGFTLVDGRYVLYL